MAKKEHPITIAKVGSKFYLPDEHGMLQVWEVKQHSLKGTRMLMVRGEQQRWVKAKGSTKR